jgi:hypothetical protein
MSKPAFEVDKAGLAKLLAQRGKRFAVLELIQNALDEQVTRVDVQLVPTEDSRGYHTLTVTDDSPEGFADLAHAYTLFAESKKKDNPELRGRFNLGEKLVLALCRRAEIRTTTGVIRFEGNTRSHGRNRTETGSVFTGELRMSQSEAAEALAAARTVLVSSGVSLAINGERLPPREPEGSFTETLTTVTADAEGFLRSSLRKTRVDIYQPDPSGLGFAVETPMLYELGIPVVEIDCPWHVDVRQKVPLNSDRDNVTPAYLRKLLAAVLNTMHEQASQEALRAPWTGEALESDLLDDEAVEAVLTARYGKKRVAFDPSDPEANKRATSEGYTVIHGGAHSGAQWDNIRRAGAALPAGKVTPSPKPWSDDPKAPKAKDIPREKWTPGMARIADFAAELAEKLRVGRVYVGFVNTPNEFSAAYGSGHLTFNIKRLGRRWFDHSPTSEVVLSLLIHEFGHEYSGDHLSREYYDALCKLGARLGRAVSDNPKWFAKWGSR